MKPYVRTVFALLLLTGILSGCSEEFDPFDLVQGLRVLGISADKPDLVPGEQTTIRSLIRSEPDQTVSYRWDWCPFSSSPSDEYACSISQEELNEISAMTGVEAPQLALGNTAEVEFTYNFAELLQLYCEVVLANLENVPEGIELPSCEDKLTAVVRLIVTQSDGQRIVAIKKLNLFYEEPEDATERNTNPTIGGLRIVLPEMTEDQAVTLVEGMPFPVKYDTKYTLLLDVDPEESESFTALSREGNLEEEEENLNAIWFHEAGEIEDERTGYVDGFLTFEDLQENTLTTPEADKFAEDEMDIYIVMVDERGGLTWTTRTLRFEDAAQ